MLWMVRHCWSVGERFVMNFYRHKLILIVLWMAALCSFLNSREGVTHGDPSQSSCTVLTFFLWQIPLGRRNQGFFSLGTPMMRT